MSIYYITIFMVLVLTAIAQRHDHIVPDLIQINERVTHTALSTFTYSLLVVFLIAIAGLRFNVGADYPSYYIRYKQFSDNLWPLICQIDEPMYPLFCRISVTLGGDGALALFLSSLFTISFFAITIFRNTNKICYAMLLFLGLSCWTASFNAVRQCMAAAMVFSGYRFLRDRKWFLYLLCVLVAYLCHKSAILMFVIYFAVNRKVTVSHIIFVIIGMFIVLYSYDSVFSLAEAVLGEEIFGQEYYYRGVNILRVLVGCVPAIFFIALYYKKERGSIENFHLNILLIHAVLNVMTINSAYLARMTIYTSPFVAVSIPELSKKISNRNANIISFFVVILYLAFWLYDVSTHTALNHFQFIWQR